MQRSPTESGRFDIPSQWSQTFVASWIPAQVSVDSPFRLASRCLSGPVAFPPSRSNCILHQPARERHTRGPRREINLQNAAHASSIKPFSAESDVLPFPPLSARRSRKGESYCFWSKYTSCTPQIYLPKPPCLTSSLTRNSRQDIVCHQQWFIGYFIQSEGVVFQEVCRAVRPWHLPSKNISCRCISSNIVFTSSIHVYVARSGVLQGS